MFAFKVRPLGLVMILFALFGVGFGGYLASRSLSASSISAKSAGVPSGPKGTFSETARFLHIDANTPEVATALAADDLNGGQSLIGKPAVLLGHVVKIFTPEGNPVYLVNFAQKYSSAFSVVIEAKDYATFPDPNELVGKQVLVRGTPFTYKNQLEVKAESLDQILIVDGTKKDAPSVR